VLIYSSLKNWKGGREGEDPEKDGNRKKKEIFKCWESEDGESWWQIGKKWKDILRQAKAHSGL